MASLINMPSEYNLLKSSLGIKYKILARVTKDSISLVVSGKPDITLHWKEGKRVYAWAKRSDQTDHDIEVQIAMLQEIQRLANVFEKHNPQIKTTHEDLLERLNAWEKRKPRPIAGRGFRRRV